MQQKTLSVWAIACALTIAACSSSPQTTLSPSAVDSTSGALNPDGSSLKVDAPTGLSPNGVTVDSVRPTLTFNASSGRFAAVSFTYEVEVQNAAGAVVYSRLVGPASGSMSHDVEADLPFSDTFWFRARARAADQSGPWSGFAQFRTPERSATTPRPGTGGPVGPPRNIDIGEAVVPRPAIGRVRHALLHLGNVVQNGHGRELHVSHMVRHFDERRGVAVLAISSFG